MAHPSPQCPLSLPFYSWSNMLQIARFAPIVAAYRDSAPPPPQESIVVAPFLPRSGHSVAQGLLSLTNRAAEDSEAHLRIYDDRGNHARDVTVVLPARETVWVTSSDLENGNSDKGVLSTPTGRLQGRVLTALVGMPQRSVALAYVRSASGVVSPMSRTVPSWRRSNGTWWARTTLIGSASANATGALWVTNPTPRQRYVIFTARDSQWLRASGTATCWIPPWAGLSLDVRTLEDGPGPALRAAPYSCRGLGWGEGEGPWEVYVFDGQAPYDDQDVPLVVMSMVHDRESGLTTNLSAPRLSKLPTVQ